MKTPTVATPKIASTMSNRGNPTIRPAPRVTGLEAPIIVAIIPAPPSRPNNPLPPVLLLKRFSGFISFHRP